MPRSLGVATWSRPLVVKVTCGTEDAERCNQAFTVAATAVTAGADGVAVADRRGGVVRRAGPGRGVLAPARRPAGRPARRRPRGRAGHGVLAVRRPPRDQRGRPARRASGSPAPRCSPRRSCARRAGARLLSPGRGLAAHHREVSLDHRAVARPPELGPTTASPARPASGVRRRGPPSAGRRSRRPRRGRCGRRRRVEEAVDLVVEAPQLDRHPGLGQLPRVGLALVAQRVEAGGRDVRRGDAGGTSAYTGECRGSRRSASASR